MELTWRNSFERAFGRSPPGDWVQQFAMPVALAAFLYVLIKQHAWSTSSTLSVSVGSVMNVAAVLFLAALARGRSLQFPVHLAVPLVLSGLLALISTLLAGHLEIAIPRLQAYLGSVLLGVGVYLHYRHSQSPLALLFTALGCVHLPLFADVIFWLHEQKGGLSGYPAVPNFSNVRHLGAFEFFVASCAVAIPLLSRRLDASAWFLTFFALFGIIASGSRGALLAWLIFVVLLMIFIVRQRVRIAAFALSTLLLAGGAVWWLHVEGWLLTPNLFTRIQEVAEGSAPLSTGRMELWVAALREIIQNPLLGGGPEAFRLAEISWVVQPHNAVLQFLMQFGLLGCATWLWLGCRATSLYGGWGALWTAGRASVAGTVLLCILAASAAYSLIDGILYHLLPLTLLGVFSGLFAVELGNAAAGRRRINAEG